MIDGYKLGKFLHEKKISAEDFWFMYRLLMHEPHIAENVLKVPSLTKEEIFTTFSKWSKQYQDTHKIDWIEKAKDLEKRGFLEIWNKNPISIKMNEIKVTDKFKDIFLISDVDKAFLEFIEIYPKMIYINGHKYVTMDKSFEDLKELYAKFILKGADLLAHHRCIFITEIYIKENDNKASYKMSRYFEIFEAIAQEVEKGNITTYTATKDI